MGILWSLSGPASVPFESYPCLCRLIHAPPVAWSSRHHIIPQYAGGSNLASNLISVCPATHDWIHIILREFEKYGMMPRKGHWPHYAYKIAIQGYNGINQLIKE